MLTSNKATLVEGIVSTKTVLNLKDKNLGNDLIKLFKRAIGEKSMVFIEQPLFGIIIKKVGIYVGSDLGIQEEFLENL